MNSACYAGKQMWKESLIDSEVAILKDPTFIKAYYRLSVSQMELAQFDDAIATLQTGLTKEPSNVLCCMYLCVAACASIV